MSSGCCTASSGTACSRSALSIRAERRSRASPLSNCHGARTVKHATAKAPTSRREAIHPGRNSVLRTAQPTVTAGSDRHPVSEELVVFVVASLPPTDVVERFHELDRFYPLHLFET